MTAEGGGDPGGDDDRRKGRLSFPLKTVTTWLCDSAICARDFCLSYVKWFLFLTYNVYWIFGIFRTWHKVRLLINCNDYTILFCDH